MTVEDDRRRKQEDDDDDDEYDDEEQGVGEGGHDGHAHHPTPPPDELFDISTTVDPSYIISLIRKLLPTNVANRDPNSGGVVDGTHADHMDEGLVSPSPNGVFEVSSNGFSERMDIVDDVEKSVSKEGDDEDSCSRDKQISRSAVEEVWEEYGCILWDLAASRTHAELMVENLILEVLLANLMVSQPTRVTEICLGIIGNLSCHEVPLKHLVSTNGLIDIILEQLFLDDTQCLSEACRILTSGVLSSESSIWAKTLQSERILHRILWIAENALNAQLIEKSVGLLLAIIEGQPEVGHVLLPPLMNLGLARLLINLLSFEMGKLMGESNPERYSVLDVILRAIEALSVIDGHSQEICSNKELFQLVCDLVKLPDKAEVATSCVTAGVLIANILSDSAELASEILQDFPFLQGIFEILPLASGELEARRALWSVIARLLVRVHESEISISCLHDYVLVLVNKSDLIEDDLLDLLFDALDVENKSSARIIAIRKMIRILNQWSANKDHLEENDANEESFTSDADIGRLLDCCNRYIELNAG